MQIVRRSFPLGLAVCFLSFARAQDPGIVPPPGAPPSRPETSPERSDRLPNGKSRSDTIATEQHKKAIEEADELVEMAKDLRRQIGNAGKFVVPVGAVRKTEDIEKLARRIRGRLRD